MESCLGDGERLANAARSGSDNGKGKGSEKEDKAGREVVNWRMGGKVRDVRDSLGRRRRRDDIVSRCDVDPQNSGWVDI